MHPRVACSPDSTRTLLRFTSWLALFVTLVVTPVVTLVVTLAVTLVVIPKRASADLVTSAEAFLDRQLDKFALPGDYPAGFDTARLIQTYDVPPPVFMGSDHPLAHRADVYDSALALIAFIEAGDLVRAKELADGLRLVQATDPIGDGRLRASYFANDLLAPGNTGSSIDSPDATVGNLAWAGIALSRFYSAAVDAAFLTPANRTPYLDASRSIANWIVAHTQRDDAFGGFSLGEDGTGNPLFGTIHARSTEHNVDAYVLARNLALLDPNNPAWAVMAEHARAFVQLMFDTTNGRYRTGTRDDGSGGVEINPNPIPADAQTWTALSGIDTTTRSAAALRFTADTPLGGTFALLTEDDIGDGRIYLGLRFSTGGDHIQSEQTGGYAMALSVGDHGGWLVPEGGEAIDKWTTELATMLDNLDDIRVTAPGSDPGGIGIVATPWPAGAFSGFEGFGDPPTYSNLRHVAGTVWPALATRVAASDPQANPLRPLPEPSALLGLAIGCCVIVILRFRTPRSIDCWSSAASRLPIRTRQRDAGKQRRSARPPDRKESRPVKVHELATVVAIAWILTTGAAVNVRPSAGAEQNREAAARLAVAKSKKPFSTSQAARYQCEFEFYFSNYIAIRLDRYRQAELEFLTATQKGSHVIVRTRIVGGKYDGAAIGFWMRDAGDKWRAIDVTFEQTSVLKIIRAQVREVLSSGGAEGLIQNLSKQNGSRSDC